MSAFTISAAAARVTAAPAFANKASKVRPRAPRRADATRVARRVAGAVDVERRRRSPNPEGPAATRAAPRDARRARDDGRDARARWEKIRATRSRRVGRPTRRVATRRRESDD